MSIKLYLGREVMPPDMPPVPMLYPFLGSDTRLEVQDSLQRGRFANYANVASSIFEETSVGEADVGVLPFSWKHTLHDHELRRKAIEYVDRLGNYGKRVIIFFDSDSDDLVPFSDAIVFRTSLYRSRRRPNEFALPAWGQDLTRLFSKDRVPIRPKTSPPTVSFCGYCPPLRLPLGQKKAKESMRWLLERTGAVRLAAVQPGHYARVEAIRALRREPAVNTSFIIRPEFSFRSDGRLVPGGSETTAEHYRLEFVQNMLDSDYVLCARGFGNFSYRLYEALSCGRIPLLVDTDSVLPFHESAPWRSVLVTIDLKSLRRAGEHLLAFHSSVSGQEFEELQLRCRAFWQQWLAPEAFFRLLAGQIRMAVRSSTQP
jgi:hypothetical protein